ncbi:hypothetical protein ACFWV1_26070 [Streptomyces sp. NPDC058700]|uniref:hypothetical protein n=1 Tax=Streptomyces sp. NPDC058700 TaxID=3346607 RepID=UPI00365361BB
MTRGRGKPAEFIADVRSRYLDEVAAGAKLGEAAVFVGVHRNVPARHARTDATFAAALETAKARGRKARQDRTAHDESRYNHLGCRCRVCRTTATAARTGRRGSKGREAGGQVLNLGAGRESPTSFSLPSPSSQENPVAA